MRKKMYKEAAAIFEIATSRSGARKTHFINTIINTDK
jgi:hypothetical protein